MLFKIFTLHPDIFESFTKNALIARGVAKNIIKFEFINWRENYGIGNYKQVDDSPFGGGSGMVLMAEPIVRAMEDNECFDYSTDCNQDRPELSEESEVGKCPYQGLAPKETGVPKPKLSSVNASESPTIEDKHEEDNKVNKNSTTEHISLLPNNATFYQSIKSGTNKAKKVNVMMTPRGFPVNQKIVEWLAHDFAEINILCGRYEGFDDRVSNFVDLELSIGNFVLNGGEVGAMCLVEAVARLVPDFVTKNNSVLHDSFSSGLNEYKEFQFENSKNQYKKNLSENKKTAVADKNSDNLFDNNWWKNHILPYIEHPQYTRPNVWRDTSIPAILKTGDHAKIQKWRMKWY